MKDCVPPNRDWQQLGVTTARFHFHMGVGYCPFQPTHEYFSKGDFCYLHGYAQFLRWYRKTMADLGVELKRIPSLKKLGLGAA